MQERSYVDRPTSRADVGWIVASIVGLITCLIAAAIMVETMRVDEPPASTVQIAPASTGTR